MENTHIDNFTREIIAKSRMELDNPDFDIMIMTKIVQQETKKILIKKIILYSLMIFTIEALIFFTIRALQINLSVIISPLNSFSKNIMFYLDQMTGWMMANGYFILPVFVILIFKMIIDSRLKYS